MRTIIARSVGLGAAALLGLAPVGVAHAWDAPKNLAEKRNPLGHEDPIIAKGKAIYESNCAACHGERGRGNGPAAIALRPRPHPFNERHVASQSDSVLFWKITTGRAPMPAWGGNLSEADRWAVIHYLHTLMGPARAGQMGAGKDHRGG